MFLDYEEMLGLWGNVRKIQEERKADLRQVMCSTVRTYVFWTWNWVKFVEDADSQMVQPIVPDVGHRAERIEVCPVGFWSCLSFLDIPQFYCFQTRMFILLSFSFTLGNFIHVNNEIWTYLCLIFFLFNFVLVSFKTTSHPSAVLITH